MSYLGQVQNGVVVFEDGMRPPEGTIVRIEPVETAPDKKSLAAKLLDWAGKGVDLPEDLAKNHDHYLRGQPRK